MNLAEHSVANSKKENTKGIVLDGQNMPNFQLHRLW